MKYKFLRLKNGKIVSRHGKCEWQIGKWEKRRKLKMCLYGSHCSNKILDALDYVHGEILAEVEVGGKSDVIATKEVWQKMKITKAYIWTERDSLALITYIAELALPYFEKSYPDDGRVGKAIEAAKKVLENNTVENRRAARAAKTKVERIRGMSVNAGLAVWAAKIAVESAAYGVNNSVDLIGLSYLADTVQSVRRISKKIDIKLEAWFVNHLKEMKVFKENQ